MAHRSHYNPGYDPRPPSAPLGQHLSQARSTVPFPLSLPMAMRHGAGPPPDPQTASGLNTARALVERIDRIIAGSQQVLLERISRQDTVLSRQQEMLESMSRLIAAGRAESTKETETIRIQLDDIEKRTGRLSKGIGESMKLLATGTIKAITDCQTTIEQRLFCMEESCEGLKEEISDPHANVPEVVRHEISIGTDSPIQSPAYRDAGTTPPCRSELSVPSLDPLPEGVPRDVEEMNLDPGLHSNNNDPPSSSARDRVPSSCESRADGVDNPEQPLSSIERVSHDAMSPLDTLRVPGPSRIPSPSFDIDIDGPLDTEDYEQPFTAVPDCRRQSTPASLNLIYPSNPSRNHSLPPLDILSAGSLSPPPDTTSSISALNAIILGAGDAHEVRPASPRSRPASAPLDSPLGSAHASTISLPEPSALLTELFSQPKNKAPQVSGPSSVTLPSRPLSRAESLSSLSSLSSLEVPIFHNQILSAPAPSNRGKRGAGSRVSTSPRKRRRSSPGPKRGKFAKKPRIRKSMITKKVKKELMNENDSSSAAVSRNMSSANTNRQFIQCDNCELWYHWGCVGIRHRDPRLRDDAIFACPPCQHGKTLADPSQSKEDKSEFCSWPDCDLEDEAVKEYFVERIIGRYDHKVGGENRFSWLVKWEGYPAEESTWTPGGELTNPAKLIKEFDLAAKADRIVLSYPALSLLREAVESGWENILV